MNPTPSQPERPEHNPDGLTPEQYGAPEWRLLRKGERIQDGDQYFDMELSPEWKDSILGFVVHEQDEVYRRRVATRTPAPEAVAGEKCTNHYSDGSKIFLNRDCCYPADKDAETGVVGAASRLVDSLREEIARLREELEDAKADKDVWFDAALKEMRDQLTTARATTAERGKRIEALVDLLKRAKWIFDYSTPSYPAKTRDLQNDINTALAHATEVKEQA